MRGWCNGQVIAYRTIQKKEKPAGEGLLRACTRTRNAGPHRDYINMTDPESCRVLLDAVYEPHWAHYADRFRSTIAGFFSDEPELGNGELYVKGNVMGSDQDLPWSQPVEAALAQTLGSGWRADPAALGAARCAGPDAVSAEGIRLEKIWPIACWCAGSTSLYPMRSARLRFRTRTVRRTSTPTAITRSSAVLAN